MPAKDVRPHGTGGNVGQMEANPTRWNIALVLHTFPFFPTAFLIVEAMLKRSATPMGNGLEKNMVGNGPIFKPALLLKNT